MKHPLNSIIFFVVLYIAAITSCYSQEVSSVEKTVNEIVAKYDGTDGIDCISVAKGSGLNVVKLMLNKQLGKSFMNGVTRITVIDYGKASQEVCNSLHKDLDTFLSFLTEFDLSKEKEFSDNKYMRCFASSPESEVLSDLVIALEDGKDKMVLYMAGEIKMD